MVFVSFARALRPLACLVLAVLLGSCGGGSDGGGDVPPGALTAEQRIVAMDRVSQRFDQIAGDREAGAAEWEALRAWAAAQPEFSEVGLGDKLLWARFADGRYFLYTDNWRPLPGDAAAAARATLARGLPLRKGVPDIPRSEDALVLRFFGDEFLDGAPAMGRMSLALKERGWTVGPGSGLTVDALKGGELGFLFLTSHSGEFGPTGAKAFALMTDDEVSPLGDLDHAGDLSDGNLIYHRDRTFKQALGFGNSPRYAITAKFVRKYMKFSPGSLVILLSCHSGSIGAGPEDFRQAFTDQGAGTVVGWDGNSNAHAFDMADLLVDRLAGMNAVAAVTPPNRPHVFDEVWDYLDQKGLLVTPPAAAGDSATPVVRFGSGFHALQPIISELQATGPDKLVVYGEFGAGPLRVTVGGQDLFAAPAGDGKSIDVELGPTAFGEVIVTSQKRRSNPRVLGSWQGQVKYTQHSGTGSCGAVFQESATLQLHLRADMHGTRDKIDGPVRNNRWIVVPAGDSQGTWDAKGECRASDGSVEERWSGSGAFPLYFYDTRQTPPDSPFLKNVLLARIDAVERRWQLGLAQSPVAQRKSVFDGTSTQQEPLTLRADLQSYLNLDGDFTDLMPFGMFLPLDASWGVAAGHHQKQSADEPDQTLVVDWQAMPVAPAYDDKIGW
jgi:hypothetical protein